MEKLFIGNIMHRTSDKLISYHGLQSLHDGIKNWYVKENAVLYRTKDNKFIDVEEIFNNPIKKRINKLEKTMDKEYHKCTALPVISLSNLRSSEEIGYSGVFVDSDSLKSFSELQKEMSKKR